MAAPELSSQIIFDILYEAVSKDPNALKKLLELLEPHQPKPKPKNDPSDEFFY